MTGQVPTRSRARSVRVLPTVGVLAALSLALLPAGAARADTAATTSTATAGSACETSTGSTCSDPALASLPGPLPNGRLPGPPVLYAPAPDAPELDSNSSLFQAPPVLVSGTEAYQNGEYLYQGYLYADHGAGTNGTGPGGYVGQLTYPTDTAVYGNNAANLVEFRVSALDTSELAYRFTLNTMQPDPNHGDTSAQSSTAIVTLAFDTGQSPSCSTLPHDPGAPFPGTDQVITTWGTGAELGVCNGGAWTLTPLAVSQDLTSRQITVTVPRSLSNPSGTWGATLAAGLYDGAGGWLHPQGTADASHPGGAPSSGTVSGIFDLGFRFNEPVSSSQTLPLFSGVGDSPDTMQAAALAKNDPTAFEHPIDFDRLNRSVTDPSADGSTVPTSGVEVRILASHISHGEGIDSGAHPLGNLVPYTLVIPSGYQPGRRLPLMLALHSAGDHYWQYTGSQGQYDWAQTHQFFVASPEGRGPDTWFLDDAEVDVFEVWNDVARHFDLDPTQTVAYGYSMGGAGTHWLSSLYPDLFGRAYEVVGGVYTSSTARPGFGGDMMPWLDNMRNVPVLDVNGFEDEADAQLVFLNENLAPGGPLFDSGLQKLGYRYISVDYPVAEHLTFAGAGYLIPLSEAFLDHPVVERGPAHVTFTYVPMTNNLPLGLVHDHTYWVSDISLADPNFQSTGSVQNSNTVAEATVDAVSAGFGVGDPTPYNGAGSGVGPAVLPYIDYYQAWGSPPLAAAANALSLNLTNVGSARYDLAAARIDPKEPITLSVSTTSPTVLLLDGAFRGHPMVSVDGSALQANFGPVPPGPVPIASPAPSEHELTVAVPSGTHTVMIAPPPA